MISKDKLDETILELEQNDTTYATCERLAWLYIVRDHMNGQSVVQPTPVDVSGKSEFLQEVNGRDSAAAWAVMDELMSTLEVMNHKVYNWVIEKIQSVPHESHQSQDKINM